MTGKDYDSNSIAFTKNAVHLACSPKVDPGAMRDWRRDSAAELSP